MTENNVLSALHFNEAGLIAAIAVDHQTESVLMMAWMNALAITTLDPDKPFGTKENNQAISKKSRACT